MRAGANCLHQDQDGNTAYHKAAINGHQHIMNLLIEMTLEPDSLIALKNKNSQTANDLLKQ